MAKHPEGFLTNRMKGILRCLLVACFLVCLFPITSYVLHNYTITGYQYVPTGTNSTVLYGPREGFAGFLTANESNRLDLDVNSTLTVKIIHKPAGAASYISWPSCNTTGDIVFQKRSAKFVATINLSSGTYELMVCNFENSTAFGTFDISIYEFASSKPFYDLGTFAEFLTIPAAVWGAFWILQNLTKHGRSYTIVHTFSWALVAPVLLLFITSGSLSALYYVNHGQHVGALTFTDLWLSVIAIIMNDSLVSGWLMIYLRIVSTAVTSGLLVYLVRLTILLHSGDHKRTVPSLRTPTGIFARLQRILISYLFPNSPDIGVFVRLTPISLVMIAAYLISPITYLREEIPYIGQLVPESLSNAMTSYAFAFLSLIIAFPFVLYSLKWKPYPMNGLFRKLAYVYLGGFLIALVTIISAMTNDFESIARFIWVWKTMIPSALLVSYLTWAAELIVRNIAHLWVEPMITSGESKTWTP